MRGANRAATALTFISCFVLLFGLAQLFAGAVKAGVTTDEPIHSSRTDTWFEHGWYVPESYLIDGEPDPSVTVDSPYVYGPAFSLVAHVVNTALRNDDAFNQVARTEEAYTVRHLVVALLAALTIAAVGLAVFLLTGQRQFGLWAAAGLAAVPPWLGQSFFNIKDVPAAAGFTLVTVALILAFTSTRERPASRPQAWLIGAMLFGGIFIGAGTRISLWLPFMLAVAAFVVLRLVQWRFSGVGADRASSIAVAVGAGIGLISIGAIYPQAAAEPFKFLYESVNSSSGYTYSGYTLTAGQYLTQEPPLWYLPTWIGASMPILLGLIALVGLGGAVVALFTRRDLRVGLVLVQVFMLPLAVLVAGSSMYGGVRQHLYVLPALLILAGVGAAWLWRWAGSRPQARRWRGATAALLSLALLVPMAEQTALFPYNYAYVNPVAGIGGVNDRWETDYWFASAPEAIARVPAEQTMRCSFFLVPGWEPEEEAAIIPCGGDQIEAHDHRRGSQVEPGTLLIDDTYWVIARRRAGNTLPPNCEPVDNVTRWLRGEQVIMAYVARCR